MREKPYLLLLPLVSLWCVLIVLPPILTAIDGSPSAMYHLFSRICHQDANRSLYILSHPLGVCARCSMIYFGFLIGGAVAGLWQRNVQNFSLWFIVILLPMLLDVALDFVGLHQTTMMMRIVTGLVFGLGSGILLIPLLVEALQGQPQAVVASSDEQRRNTDRQQQSTGVSHAKT